MTSSSKISNTQKSQHSAGKRMLLGAAIGLVLIQFFLITAGDGKPGWPRFWMIRPLIIVPMAGAVGGLFFYYMQQLNKRRGFNVVFTNAVGILVFVIGLWMGLVLGLDGTYWD
jgi:heme/copper-type cytochrome/quinol oxidase subunit 4